MENKNTLILQLPDILHSSDGLSNTSSDFEISSVMTVNGDLYFIENTQKPSDSFSSFIIWSPDTGHNLWVLGTRHDKSIKLIPMDKVVSIDLDKKRG